MFPRSAAQLSPGDFCFIQRTDGRYVPFVFLHRRAKERNYFIGGIANVVLEENAIDLIPLEIAITEYALLHIKCFKENDTPIAGNLRDRIPDRILSDVRSATEDMNVGAKISVWGWKTIYKYADIVGTE